MNCRLGIRIACIEAYRDERALKKPARFERLALVVSFREFRVRTPHSKSTDAQAGQMTHRLHQHWPPLDLPWRTLPSTE